jgi:hypothetical protein
MISIAFAPELASSLIASPARMLGHLEKMLSGYSDAQILACSGLCILLLGTLLSFLEKLRRPAPAPVVIEEKKNLYAVPASGKPNQQTKEQDIRVPISARS